MTVGCPGCGGTLAHVITCPVLGRQSAAFGPPVPMDEVVSAGGPMAAIAKVLQVDRDLGHPADPADLAQQVIDELAKSGIRL